MSDTVRKLIVLGLVLAPLGGTCYAGYVAWGGLVTWLDLILLFSFYTLVAFGVTVGFHRYLTHRSFRTVRVIKFALVILGSMSFQGAPLSWVANHRQHHAFADEEGDPHSPNMGRGILAGFYHSHVGWMFGTKRADPRQWTQDLLRDPDIVFLNRFTPVWVLLSLLIPFLVGGWSGLLWGGLVRIFLVHHVTWSVNSLAHMFGSRPFNTKDTSTNNWVVGLLGFGEGFHNTHHASPRSARHGLYWWHPDLSWLAIKSLEKLHLATDVYVLDPNDVKQAVRVRAGSVKAVLCH